jgi:hypothetical protein
VSALGRIAVKEQTMESSDSGSTSGQGETITAPATIAVADGADRLRSHRQIWIIALSAGVAAGLLSWLMVELTHGFFRPRLYPVSALGLTAMRPSPESQQLADTLNATLAFVILGGVTGLVMGIAGTFCARSAERPGMVVLAALMAAAAGAIVGLLASRVLIPFFFRGLVPDRNDLLTPIMIHGGIWMAIGAVGGLAFAVGMRSWKRLPDVIAGACFGALLATFCFHALSGTLFPMSGSTEPVANTWIVRLIAMFLVPVLISAGAARGAQGGFLHPAAKATEA